MPTLVPPDGMANNFARDLSADESAVITATQGPVQAACFETILTQSAWTSKPSWYVVTKQDRMLPPELLRATAERINAKLVELASSHVPQASHPQDVAAVILEAAAIKSRQ